MYSAHLGSAFFTLAAYSLTPCQRESSLSTTYWSESTESSRGFQQNGLVPWGVEFPCLGCRPPKWPNSSNRQPALSSPHHLSQLRVAVSWGKAGWRLWSRL